MSGIAGIKKAGSKALVEKMLKKMSHRGKNGMKVYETNKATIGVLWPPPQADFAFSNSEKIFIQDSAGNGHLAKAELVNGTLKLERDELGIAPLYYGKTSDGTLCFASEVKALLLSTNDVNEFPAGHVSEDEKLTQYFQLQKHDEIDESPEAIASKLRQLLTNSILVRIKPDSFGSWLSGGLDSSVFAALAKPYVKSFHTFSAGIKNAPDLEYANALASHIKSNHHEIIVDLDMMIKNLPDVIYHLESFDALLVRSSIMNYLVSKAASNYVEEIFSGEGGDELFAGYEYIKSLPAESIADELVDITGRLHNTAFQRVDRCAYAHSTVPHVVFADPNVFNFALTIPTKYKLKDNVEKWILRQAVKDVLPQNVLHRTKAKFWEGAGVQDLILDYASARVTDYDFNNEKFLPNGCILNSKEELYYYRIFKEYFGNVANLDWMGRTKGVAN